MKIKDRIRKFIRENKEYKKSINEDYYTDRLDNYLDDPMYGFLDIEDFKFLQDKFPTDKNIKVYRGLNFKDQEAYTKFLKATNNGTKYNKQDISSWSPNYETAKQFAVTRPTYLEFADKDTLDLIAKQKYEKITGYKGVILEAVATTNNSVDIRKYRKAREQELLISDPNLSIKIVEEFGRFQDELDLKDIIGFLNKYKNSDFKRKAINYILYTHKDQITNEAWEYLFNLFISNVNKFQFEIIVDKFTKKVYGEEDETYIGIGINSTEELKDLINNLEDFKKAGLTDRIITMIKPKLKQGFSNIEKYKRKYPDLELKYNPNVIDYISKLADLCNLSKEWKSVTTDQNFKIKYKNLTSRQAMQNLSKLKGKEQDQAIDQLQRDLMKLFKNL